LRNTGNIGIKVRVTFKWRLLGQGWYEETRTLKVRRGGTRDVDVSVPVSGDMIDAHQSADSDCRSNVKIIDTYGSTPWEDGGDDNGGKFVSTEDGGDFDCSTFEADPTYVNGDDLDGDGEISTTESIKAIGRVASGLCLD
jgi:hypothetical protein